MSAPSGSRRPLSSTALIGTQALSLAGAMVQVVGLTALAARVSPMLVAIVLAARFGPGAVVVFLAAGRLDRLDRRRTFATTLGVQAGVAMAGAAAIALFGPHPLVLVLATLAYSPGSYLDATLYPALLSVTASDARRSLGRSTSVARTSRALGAALGGLCVTLAAALPWIVNALSFLPLLYLLASRVVPERPGPLAGAEVTPATSTRMRDVPVALWARPELRAPTVLVVIAAVFAIQQNLLLSLAGAPSAIFIGTLIALSTLGGAAGGFLRAPASHRYWPRLGYFGLFLAAALAGLSGLGPRWFLIPIAACAGFAVVAVSLHGAWLCTELPAHMTVRAFALWQVTLNGATAIGAPLAALVARFGIPPALWCGAWALVAVACAFPFALARHGSSLLGDGRTRT